MVLAFRLPAKNGTVETPTRFGSPGIESSIAYRNLFFSRLFSSVQGLKKGAPWPLQSAFYGSAFFNLFVYDPNVGP